MGPKETETPAVGMNRIMIYGPRDDGTYVVEFKTAAGEALAISIPRTETAVIRHFQERMRYGLFVTAGQPDAGAEILQRQPRHHGAAGEGRSQQRGLAARTHSLLQQGRRRAGGAGQPHGGAEIIPRRPRHHGAAGKDRSEQRGL